MGRWCAVCQTTGMITTLKMLKLFFAPICKNLKGQIFGAKI
jgi:hypothetical protein